MSETVAPTAWLALIKQNPKSKLQRHSLYGKYARELETTKVRQIRGRFWDGKGGYCATGLLVKKYWYDPVLWFGLFFGERKFQIIDMNDSDNKSFKEIAEWIRL